MVTIDTDRLRIGPLTLADAPFILELVNTPGWLRFIGDRKVKSVEDAEAYLRNGPMESYSVNGFGLWRVSLRDSGEAIGMCGLLRRKTLDLPDIGFAFLPAYHGNGFAREAVRATLDAARQTFGIRELAAITVPDNEASQNLLRDMGFVFNKQILGEQGEPLHLFIHYHSSGERTAV